MPGFINHRLKTCLTQIYGENLNQQFELKGPQVLIGRSPKSTIRLECPNVSRKHCYLKEVSNNWYITDNNSQNGTYINGVLLPPGANACLQCGDIIFLGPPSEMPQAFCVDVEYGLIPLENVVETEHQPINESSLEEPEILSFENSKSENESCDSKCTKQEESLEKNKSTEEDGENECCIASTISRPKRKARSSLQVSQAEKIPLKKFKETKGAKLKYEADKSVDSYPVSNNIDCNQINEISSTGNNEMEDSLSLLDIQKEIESDTPSSTNDINKPGCSHNNIPVGEKEQIAHLKSKIALISNEMKKLKKEKSLMEKNFAHQNKKLNEEFSEQVKLKEALQNCELRAKNEVKKELLDTFGEELVCIICSELLVKPSVLDCAHTFCDYCIKVWKSTKNECPMCRKKIVTVTRVLTLDNFIEKTVKTLTPEQRDDREKLIKEREELEKLQEASSKSKKGAVRRYRNRRSNNRNQNRSRDSVEIVGERDVFPLPSLPFPLFLNNSNFSVPDVVRQSMLSLNHYFS